jgi:hypothetical protein
MFNNSRVLHSIASYCLSPPCLIMNSHCRIFWHLRLLWGPLKFLGKKDCVVKITWNRVFSILYFIIKNHATPLHCSEKTTRTVLQNMCMQDATWIACIKKYDNYFLCCPTSRVFSNTMFRQLYRTSVIRYNGGTVSTQFGRLKKKPVSVTRHRKKIYEEYIFCKTQI